MKGNQFFLKVWVEIGRVAEIYYYYYYYYYYFLGDDNILQKNWDDLLQRVKGRLDKWKWILPNLSYRGRTLIVNNLVALLLWHRLVCIDPPVKLMAGIQADFVDFFWEYFIFAQRRRRPRSGSSPEKECSLPVVFLLRTVGNLGIDKSLFLMDPKCLDILKLLSFYQHLFKIWSFIHIQRTENLHSIFWFLNEPLIFKARLDLSATIFFTRIQ